MTNPTRRSTSPLPRRIPRALLRLLLGCVLTAAVLPGLAQTRPEPIAAEAPGAAAALPDAAASHAAPTIHTALPGAGSLSERALFLAADINRLLIPGKTDAALAGYEPTDSRVKRVLHRALALLGTPYRWGGTSPDKGFDCSGLVSYVFRNAMGIELPRVSREMAATGELVSDRAKLAAGDLVFFGRRGRVDHVGIYLGEGRFVHAPSTGKDVMVSSLVEGYWSHKYLQARRVAGI